MRKIIVGCVAVGAVVLLSGSSCNSGDANQHDVTGVPWRNPDKIEVYANIDQHPNVVRLCIDHVAFATTSREYTSLVRVPEWDVPFCGATPATSVPK